MDSLASSKLAAREEPKNKTSESNIKLKAPNDDPNNSLSSSTNTEDKSGDSGVSSNEVLYDVEHLATFSTTGTTCHETNNRSTTNSGSSSNSSIARRSANNNNNNDNDNNKCAGNSIGIKSKTNGTKAAATKTPTADNDGHHSTSNESPKATTFDGDDDNVASSQTTTPKVALQRLFELEKLSGIWTQRMQIELRDDFMLIIDCETNSIVERFQRRCVTRPEAFNQHNDIYNNIVVFIIEQRDTNSPDVSLSECGDQEVDGEIHIFQCVSHKAVQLVSDILSWKAGGRNYPPNMNNSNTASQAQSIGKSKEKKPEEKASTPSGRSGKPVVVQVAAAGPNGPTSSLGGDNVPIVNVNVKETVQVFNQIAALRERGKSPTNRPGEGSASNGHSTAAGSGNSDRMSVQLTPAPGQFYKQRSIRATLAPKYAAKGAHEGQPAEEAAASAHRNHKASCLSQKQTKTNNLSSCSSSSDAARSSNSSYSSSSKQQPLQQARLPAADINHGRDLEQPKRQAATAAGSRLTQQTSSSPPHHHNKSKSSSRPGQQQRTQSDSSRSFASSSSQSKLEQITTNESYVSVLNHCFDDIEKFIIRLQQAIAAIRELQSKRKLSKRFSSQESSGGNGRQAIVGSPSELSMLQAKARGPSEDDYFEILSKFKLAFNLLAKLKGCIHEPNAPELVHFLFTPLAIIIESARNALPPIDPTMVGIPYLNGEALELLSNCCSSKESDLWVSLGPNWTQTIDASLLRSSRLPSSFQPIFSDGWAPIIGELELIGLVLGAGDSPAKSSGKSAEQRLPPTYAEDLHHQHLLSMDYASSEQASYQAPGKAGRLHSSGAARSRGRQPAELELEEQEDYYQRSYQAPLGRPDLSGQPRAAGELAKQRHSAGSCLPAPPPPPLTRGYAAGRSKQQSSGQPESRFGEPFRTPLMEPEPEQYQANQSDEYAELQEQYQRRHQRSRQLAGGQFSKQRPPEHPRHQRHSSARHSYTRHCERPPQNHQLEPFEADYFDQLQHEAMLLDMGPAQTDWFYELQARGALVVRVLFTRIANNDKELSVARGELLEVLDDSRKWWRARNIEQEVAHVPHTIVAVMHGYQTLDELLANNPTSVMALATDEQSRGSSNRFTQEQWHGNKSRAKHGDSRNASGFRYF